MQGTDEGLILGQKFKIQKKLDQAHLAIFIHVKVLQKNKNSQLKQQASYKLVKKIKGRWSATILNKALSNISRHSQFLYNSAGIAKLYDYGYQGQKIFMVIDLLDSSLEELFQNHNRKFSLSTVYQIGIQIINRLQAIHRKGFVHRDIKANNFMVGKGINRNIVYIIDFGLAKRYKDPKTGNHIPFKEGKSLVGTARYASIASHMGYQQGRKDDLQSLGFLLLYFLRGKLPWQGVQLKNKTQKYAQIGRIKRQTSIQQLCKTLGEGAEALARYFAYVRTILFAQEPKYDLVRKILREELVRLNQQDKPLDWLKEQQK